MSTDVFLGSMSQINKPDDIIIADFGVDRGSVKDSAKAEPFLQQWINTFENDPDYWLEIEGYSDCVGVEHSNNDLRRRRAKKVFELFTKARSRVRFHRAAPSNDYLVDNGDPLQRAINRGVTIHFGKLSSPQPAPQPPTPTPEPKTTACPPASGAPVGTLGEYIDLIRCAETTTGYSAREMLAMLRQMYYGESWSATSQDPNWKFVIPCSPNLGNPKAKLGDNLFQALHDSDTVEGTDLGHVFTGLEAMTCPASSVTLEKKKFGVGIELTVNLSNEAFATWGGDLGATAGAMVACWMMTNDERAKEPMECHQGSTPQGLEYYFLNLQAPPHDLEGDIAPFVMRAAALGLSCGSSLEQQYSPKDPISTDFSDYFSGFPTGKTSKDRYACFAEAIGGTVVNGKITNRADLVTKYETKVLSFAWAHYVKLKKEIPSSDPTAQLLLKHSTGALNLFFNWLEARMQP